MEKNKILIIGLVVVIIALIAGLAIALTGNNDSGVLQASEGMEIYNFDSAFTMEVPNGTKFLKTRMDINETGILTEGVVKDYFSKNKEFDIFYLDSHMLNDERVNYILAIDDENATYEQDGDFIIQHYPDASGKVGKTWEKSDFKESVAIHKGTELIIIEGNDMDLIKSMAKTIKFRE